MNQEIINLLRAALECSVFLNPRDPGLTVDELLEVGQRVGYQKGELGDALPHIGQMLFGVSKIRLDANSTASWHFLTAEEPEYRNLAAFDFIVDQLNQLARAEGAASAFLPRDVLVERAVSTGLSRLDVEVAITYQVMANILAEKDDIVSFRHKGPRSQLPSEQLNAMPGHVQQKPFRRRAHPLVKDIIERRQDGRPKQVEPLDAFADSLEELGYGAFRLWWKQTVAELRQCNPNMNPVATSVLAAALVEGVLTFVVTHARSLSLAVFQSKDFERDPRSWKIDDLVASAASGSNAAVLDLQTKNRAETLIRNRQRIHAGRMLSQFPGGPPDLRPEEARDAKATADQVVRAVLDWLQAHPPGS